MDVYIVAIFRTREQTMRFNAEMTKRGCKTSIINTPRDVLSACGISVKFGPSAICHARRVIRAYDFSSFAGFYAYEGGRYSFIM
ncbi:MAG: DUF3343 domain-containing protein [Clostridiales bacterium]|nr:DUF3343 domain-containing protein [Clostridiales bacterium]